MGNRARTYAGRSGAFGPRSPAAPRAASIRTLWLVLAVLLSGLLPYAVGNASAATTIYYYQDEKGVFHFTNVPDSPRYGIFAVFRNHPEVSREEILRLARKHAVRNAMDPYLVQAVIEAESGYVCDAVSPAGAEGLMQIMPQTQDELGVSEPFDAEENIDGGVRYLRKMLDRFGKVELALAAYNAGPHQVDRYKGIPPFRETRDYVAKVMTRFNALKAR